MAKQKATPETIKLTEAKSGKVKELDIVHAAKFLVGLTKQNFAKNWELPEGYFFDGADIVKK